MAELNTMLLEHARNGVQAELDAAVTNGDTDAARKAADKLSALNQAAAPPPAPTTYGEKEIRAELDKLDWFGTDPKKSAKAMELGKTMNPKKFPSAVEFAAALVKAVDSEFAPAGASDDGDGEGEGADGDGEGEGTSAKPAVTKRKTDGPGDNDTGSARRTRTAGPWLKMSDAPSDIQKDINRTAEKWAPKTKEGREKYVTAALASHYNAHLRKAGKK